MNVVIFKDLTTEEALLEIEGEALKYDNLDADMEDKEQRKFVKDSASLINGILKKLERARIDKTSEYKVQVEAEAKRIKIRLNDANKPFTLLIDAHKEKRAKILAEEKAAQEARDLVVQISNDHSDAITLDKIRTFEIEDAIRLKEEHEKSIAAEARKQAEKETELAEERADQAEKDKILAEAKAKRDAVEAEELAEKAKIQAVEDTRLAEIKRQDDEKAELEAAETKRKADKAHFSTINLAACQDLIDSTKCDLAMAKLVVTAIAKGQIKNVTIKY